MAPHITLKGLMMVRKFNISSVKDTPPVKDLQVGQVVMIDQKKYVVVDSYPWRDDQVYVVSLGRYQNMVVSGNELQEVKR